MDEPARTRPVSAFRLLANRRIVTILDQLDEAPATAAMLRHALNGVPLPTVYDDMRQLEATGVADRLPDRAPTHWALQQPGRQLRSLGQVTRSIVARLLPPHLRAADHWQEMALARLADERTLAIVLVLLTRGSLRACEIERALGSRVTHRGLFERLAYLVDAGVAQRVMTPSGARSRLFTLNSAWQPLGAVLVLAARWNWQSGLPFDSVAAARDLASVVAVTARSARLPPGVAGICTVAVTTASSAPVMVHLWLGRSTLVVVGLVDSALAQATAAGPPSAWCESLVARHPVGLCVEGRAELVDRAIPALSEALFDRLARSLRCRS
jgi:DNA-binding HxlR family transcriptional regulator